MMRLLWLYLLWVLYNGNKVSAKDCIKYEVSGAKYQPGTNGEYTGVNDPTCDLYEHQNSTEVFLFQPKNHEYAIGSSKCDSNRSTWMVHVDRDGVMNEYGYDTDWVELTEPFDVRCSDCHRINVNQTNGNVFNGVYNKMDGNICNSMPVYFSTESNLFIYYNGNNMSSITGVNEIVMSWTVSNSSCTEQNVIAIGSESLMPWENAVWFIKGEDDWKIGMALYVYCTNCTEEIVNGPTSHPQILGLYQKEDWESYSCAKGLFEHVDGGKYLTLFDDNELKWKFVESNDICNSTNTENNIFESQALPHSADPHNVLLWYERQDRFAWRPSAEMRMECLEQAPKSMGPFWWFVISLSIGIVSSLFIVVIYNMYGRRNHRVNEINETFPSSDVRDTSKLGDVKPNTVHYSEGKPTHEKPTETLLADK